uniref:EF-hand domain-containing protein n=1 Tax=Kalanchoe fedtschenkoi TaxID=63787 RepID=A0A7N0V6T6_KALFE
MEEMRKVARAYYNNGSDEVQLRTHGFFESMDTDKDGKIQFHEFLELLYREGYIHRDMNHDLFSDLDVDRNGVLDFNEFLTLFYVIKTKNGFCRQCRRCLKGLYFTYITCFDSPTAGTFDLCSDCYSVWKWTGCHPHINFADNALLLRARRR